MNSKSYFDPLFNQNPEFYINVYNEKGGGGPPSAQHRVGFGIFSTLFRLAYPVLRTFGSHLLKQSATSAVAGLEDFSRGEKVGRIVKRRGKEALKQAAIKTLGGKRKRKPASTTTKKNGKKTRKKTKINYPLFIN